MKIVAICGAGIGTSAILKLNAERVLDRLGLDADVTASDLAGAATAIADAQVVLTSPELAPRLPASHADVIVVENYFDIVELQSKLDAALG